MILGRNRSDKKGWNHVVDWERWRDEIRRSNWNIVNYEVGYCRVRSGTFRSILFTTSHYHECTRHSITFFVDFLLFSVKRITNDKTCSNRVTTNEKSVMRVDGNGLSPHPSHRLWWRDHQFLHTYSHLPSNPRHIFFLDFTWEPAAFAHENSDCFCGWNRRYYCSSCDSDSESEKVVKIRNWTLDRIFRHSVDKDVTQFHRKSAFGHIPLFTTIKISTYEKRRDEMHKDGAIKVKLSHKLQRLISRNHWILETSQNGIMARKC